MLKKDLEFLKQYKPFFTFLLIFFAVYAGLTLIYQLYLGGFNEAAYEVDGFTRLVARQTKWLAETFGYVAEAEPHPLQPSIMLTLNGKYVSRVVEGCNAISVMILFVAFVVAFRGKWKNTVLFLIFGVLLIHILNVLRIALLSMALLKYRKYEDVLHGVIFPAVIYGVVFLLWVVWVNKFSVHAKKS